MKKRILVTGSSGMLGIDLYRELKKNYDVSGADIYERDDKELRVKKFYKWDITDEERITEVFKKAKPDIVIHAAAWTDVDGCENGKTKAKNVNEIGTTNIALECKRAGIILVYISTDFVFDGKKKRPYKETDKPRPISVYGRSKLKGEDAVKRTLKKYFILRTSWLYGKHGKNFVDTIIAKAKEGKRLRVVDDQVGSPTYTKDLAKAIHVLLNKIFVQRTAYSVQRPTQYAKRGTQYGVYHISNSGSVSWFEYTKEILKLAGSKTKVVSILSQELARPARRPAMSVLDNSKFIKFTGYKMRNWQEALRDYVR